MVFELSVDEQAGHTTALFFAFNTIVTVRSYSDAELCKSAFREVHALCKKYERLFSRTLEETDISRLNNAKGAEVEIAADTFELLEAARFYCEESQGVFDISIGSASRLWDFKAEKVPSAEALAQAIKHVDWRKLSLRVGDYLGTAEDARADEGVCTKDDMPLSNTAASANDVVSTSNSFKPEEQPAATRYFARLLDSEMAVDAGGIAKGYIADKLSECLANNGFTNFMINLGGNVIVKGPKPDGTPWKVGVQDPQNKQGVLEAIDVIDGSVVTSGIYERGFTKEGVHYHHILDPLTGFPVDTDIAGVTVVAERSLDAEGYSTTLLALGLEKACAFVRQHPSIQAAYIVSKNGKLTIEPTL